MDVNGHEIKPHADLYGADLYGADLRGANLSGASGVIDGGSPDGWRAYGWLRDGYLSIRVGCHEKRADEARAYWCDTHPAWARRREIAAAVQYITAVAAIRNWPIEAPAEEDVA